MIKLNRLNKYFYKGEQREIHVINDCTIDLPDTGLVTFLGASGSGKTTLLNVIGGLDKADNGSISYGENTYTNRDLKKIDEYRKNNIGYIFQNYLLFNEKSVYNNLKEALEIIGVYEEDEQRKRIEYALEKVNMYKFRRKKVKNLSGGQMQRVSIARALVKDAKIIIADEPTGNIDSANTIEVMNILKKLSETTLIILVTHEESIANYYSDRIINIKDGKVIDDSLVTERKKLNNESDQKIYLLDYEKEENTSDKLNVELYYDEKATTSNVQIIIKNNTIYIKSDKKIINLNESSINVVNEKYQDYEVNAKLTNEETFDTSWYKTNNVKLNPFVKFFKNLGRGFTDYFSGKKSYIFFMIIFIILGGITAGSCINLIKYTNKSEEIVFDDENYYFVMDEEYIDTGDYTKGSPFLYNYEIVQKAYRDGIIDKVLYLNNQYVNFSLKQSIVNSFNAYYEVYILPYQNEKLIFGNAPKSGECVIGKDIADDALEALNLKAGKYDYFIGKDLNGYIISGVVDIDSYMIYCNKYEVYYPYFYIGNTWVIDLDDGTSLKREIFIDRNYDTSYYSSYIGDYESNKKYIDKIIEGRLPETNTEVILSKTYKEFYNLGDAITSAIIDGLYPEKVLDNDTVYTVVGFYENKNYGYDALSMDSNIIGMMIDNYKEITSGEATLKFVNFDNYVLINGAYPTKTNEIVANINSGYKVGDKIKDYTVTGIYDYTEDYKAECNYSMDAQTFIISLVYSDEIYNCAFKIDKDDVAKAKRYFEENDYKLISVKDYQTEAYQKEYRKSKILNIVLTIFLIALVILFTYLTSRSKMIKQIYSIGVYRSLGQSKKDIKKKAIYISVAQTTTSSLIGYALVIGIYLYLGKNYIDLFENFSTKPALLLLGVPVLYFINIVFSLIPYNALLRKTPSQINSKFDI